MIGFAVGNGTSRKDYDLNRLNDHGLTVGCNRVFKVWDPDYIVTLDKCLLKEVEAWIEEHKPPWYWLSRYYPDGKRAWKSWLCINGALLKPTIEINQGWNNNSGVMAAAFLSELMRVKTCYMIGMDFFRQVPGEDNDLYAGNTGFAPGLIRVWNKLAESNPHTDFIRVGPIADIDREFYDNGLKGFTFIDYKDFPF